MHRGESRGRVLGGRGQLVMEHVEELVAGRQVNALLARKQQQRAAERMRVGTLEARHRMAQFQVEQHEVGAAQLVGGVRSWEVRHQHEAIGHVEEHAVELSSKQIANAQRANVADARRRVKLDSEYAIIVNEKHVE